jgi:two-component system sensor histidine kinase RegB
MKRGMFGRQLERGDAHLVEPRSRLRLRTLVWLRWVAVAGQTASVLLVSEALRFPIPLAACLITIAASAWLNVALTLSAKGDRQTPEWEAAAQIAFDILQLTVLLALTGGLDNPFTLFLIAPATIGAAALRLPYAAGLALLAVAGAGALSIGSLPLPWSPEGALQLPALYRWGVFTAVGVGILFTAGYASSAAREARRMEQALLATQAVLGREQQLSALGGLAAAAAHELGTPLATIQITAKELLRELDDADPLREDAALLVSQAERCRDILRKLGQRPDTGDVVHERMSLPQLLNEIADPYRGRGPEIESVTYNEDGTEPPVLRRMPEVIHALASFVDNAADFAREKVEVVCRYDAKTVKIAVCDDGPGFSADVMSKLGRPYISTRPGGEGSRQGHEGMGLGFFIAKQLLERSGARVEVKNAKKGGATVSATWPRARLQDPSLSAGF